MTVAARRVAIVTGASSGIGAEVARQAARRGLDLLLTARRSGLLDEVAEACRREGAAVMCVCADLKEAETPARLVAAAVARFGRIDTVVNNAGFGLPGLFGESDPAAIHDQVAVNLTAPMLLVRLALPHLIASRGVVVNVGSAITCVANPALGAYGATKAGLAYWSAALRRELRYRGVSVCLVEPGPIATGFFEALRNAKGGPVHPLHEAPAGWMSGRAEAVAGRIVELIDRPRRRASVPRRVVWPFRLAGGLLETFPGLADVVVARIVRSYGRKARDGPSA